MWRGQVSKLNREIDAYIGYFAKQIQDIDSSDASILVKKIALNTLLDTLARARFPSETGNKKRFIGLIDECSGWTERDCLSSVLALLLLKEEGLSTGAAMVYLTSIVDSWSQGEVVTPERDAEFHIAMSLPTTDQEKKVLSDCRYANLVYTYRNSLVHEYREPGYAIEFRSDGTNPYYHSMMNEPWQLVLPLRFFIWLAESCLKGLDVYLKANRLNPYDCYKFGSAWARNR